MSKPLDDVNSLQEAADYLRITPEALVRLARSQKIGAMKQGRSWTFPRAAIEDYVTAHTTPARPANPHGLTDRSLANLRRRARTER